MFDLTARQVRRICAVADVDKDAASVARAEFRQQRKDEIRARIAAGEAVPDVAFVYGVTCSAVEALCAEDTNDSLKP